jgi:hypothetical protein
MLDGRAVNPNERQIDSLKHQPQTNPPNCKLVQAFYVGRKGKVRWCARHFPVHKCIHGGGCFAWYEKRRRKKRKKKKEKKKKNSYRAVRSSKSHPGPGERPASVRRGGGAAAPLQIELAMGMANFLPSFFQPCAQLLASRMVLLAYKARASIGHRFATRSFGSVRSLHLGIIVPPRSLDPPPDSCAFGVEWSGVMCSSSSRFITDSLLPVTYPVQLLVVVCFVGFSFSFSSSYIYISMKFDVFHPRRPLGFGT